MPKFTTSEDGVINDLTKKAGLNEDTLKRRNCVKREFESFISAKGLVSLDNLLLDSKELERMVILFLEGMSMKRKDSEDDLPSKNYLDT